MKIVRIILPFDFFFSNTAININPKTANTTGAIDTHASNGDSAFTIAP